MVGMQRDPRFNSLPSLIQGSEVEGDVRDCSLMRALSAQAHVDQMV